MTTTEYENFILRVWVGKGNLSDLDLRNLFIASAGLGGETGEALEKLKKYVRDGTLDKILLVKELGDILYYLTMLGKMFGFTLEDIMRINVEKIQDRLDRGVLHGNGDTR